MQVKLGQSKTTTWPELAFVRCIISWLQTPNPLLLFLLRTIPALAGEVFLLSHGYSNCRMFSETLTLWPQEASHSAGGQMGVGFINLSVDSQRASQEDTDSASTRHWGVKEGSACHNDSGLELIFNDARIIRIHFPPTGIYYFSFEPAVSLALFPIMEGRPWDITSFQSYILRNLYWYFNKGTRFSSKNPSVTKVCLGTA